MNPESTIETNKLVIQRVFAAPVETVYKAWSDPAILEKWFAPNERWVKPAVDVDTVVGGRRNVTMTHSDGESLTSRGHYTEVVPNERLVFTWNWMEDPDGPSETLMTVEFQPVTDGTQLTLTHERITSATTAQGFTDGWNFCLDMLARYLDGTHSFA